LEPVRIVVRFKNGKIIKGYTQNFFPNKPAFHVSPGEGTGAQDTTEVRMEQLKAVFFVKDFAGDRSFKERKALRQGEKAQGRLMEVTCSDGEIIVGSTTGYDPKRPGFFLFPVDAAWNNVKAYIVSSSVTRVRFL
jgi:Family of unknown function (DUF6982)